MSLEGSSHDDAWLFQLDGDLADLARERVFAFLVVIGHRGLAILADIRAFIGREKERLRPVDLSFGDLLAVDEDRARAALAQAAALVRELVADRDLALGQGTGSGDLVRLEAEEVISVHRLAILDVQAPTAEATGLGN